MSTFPCIVCTDPIMFSRETVASEFFDDSYVICQHCTYDQTPDDVKYMIPASSPRPCGVCGDAVNDVGVCPWCDELRLAPELPFELAHLLDWPCGPTAADREWLERSAS